MAKQITNAVLAEKIDNLALLQNLTQNMMREHISSDDRHFMELGIFINGNGTPGAKTRLDRLEQIENHRNFHLKALWTAITTTAVGLILTFVANWIWG
jgi:hypothetical protein